LTIKEKENIVIYGQYKIIHKNPEKIFNDNKIHLVYSGSIDYIRRAAHNAVEVANHLPENYVIHILGFGKKNVIDDLVRSIENSNKNSKCKVYFEGTKDWEEYEIFMTSCDIGLNLQRKDVYASYLFPSKVLSYLSMGLNVISSEVECVVKSKVGDIVNYYKHENPEAIAKAIMSAKLFTPEELREKIQILNDEFIKDISNLI
jgi:hypothetical protein